jgi:GYF domain 2
MPSDWYYATAGCVVGPLSADELRRHARSGRITADCLIRQGPAGCWVPARHVKGLDASEVVRDSGLTEQLPSLETPATVRRPSRRLMVGGLVLLLAAALLLGIAFVRFFPGQHHRSEPGAVATSRSSLSSRSGGELSTDTRTVREKSIRAEIDRLRFEVTRLEGRERDLRHDVEELGAAAIAARRD